MECYESNEGYGHWCLLVHPYSLILVPDVYSLKFTSRFPIPYCHTMGSIDSVKYNKYFSSFCQKRGILEFIWLGMICGVGVLVQF